MLPSSKRLTKALFKSTIDQGRPFNSPFFMLKIVKKENISRFSVSVSKKVNKSAVMRSKIRRRAYSALRVIYPSIKDGFYGVLVAKPPILKISYEEILKDITDLFGKTGILK